MLISRARCTVKFVHILQYVSACTFQKEIYRKSRSIYMMYILHMSSSLKTCRETNVLCLKNWQQGSSLKQLLGTKKGAYILMSRSLYEKVSTRSLAAQTIYVLQVHLCPCSLRICSDRGRIAVKFYTIIFSLTPPVSEQRLDTEQQRETHQNRRPFYNPKC